MTRNRETRRFFSKKGIVLTALGLAGMMGAAIFQGALSAAGRALVEQSEIIQAEIKAVEQWIEGWILKGADAKKSAPSRPANPHVGADQSSERNPVRAE